MSLVIRYVYNNTILEDFIKFLDVYKEISAIDESKDEIFVTSENTRRLGLLTQLRVMLFLVVAALVNKPWTSYGKECVIKIHYFSLN